MTISPHTSVKRFEIYTLAKMHVYDLTELDLLSIIVFMVRLRMQYARKWKQILVWKRPGISAINGR